MLFSVSSRHRLISICFSHYVERARWALERFGVDFQEEAHMPFLHTPAVWRVHRGRAGRPDRASTRLSTPVLVTPAGQVIADSRGILEYVDAEFAPSGARLYPDVALREEEQRWHDRLATHSRRLAYDACFQVPESLRAIARNNVSRRQARAFSALLPFARVGMRRYLSMTPKAIERSREVCRREFDSVGERLMDGRTYLAGERFTGWDLSFACFAAPLVLPAEYGAWLPPLEDFSTSTQRLVSEMRAHPAGAFALRMFAEHRSEKVQVRKKGGTEVPPFV
jgi:glutathione S-transferase